MFIGMAILVCLIRFILFYMKQFSDINIQKFRYAKQCFQIWL